MLAAFQVRVRRVGATAHVAAAGEIDMLTAPQLQAELDGAIADGAHRVVLDLRDVAFLGSSGIAIIDRLGVTARAQGFAAVVVRGRPAVQRVLEIAGVPHRIEFVDAPDDTLSSP